VLAPADVGLDFGVALSSLDAAGFQAADASTNAWATAARFALPASLTLQSPVYRIQTTGDAPDAVTFSVKLPANVPLDTLDAYGYDDLTGRWRFLPAQVNTAGTLTIPTRTIPQQLALFSAAPITPTLIVPIEITQSLTDSAAQVASVVAPAGMQPALDGSLIGSLAPGFNVNASYRLMPVIRNYFDPRATDPGTVAVLMGSRSGRSAHIQQIAAFTAASGFDGVFVDYRDLPDDQRANLTLLMEELSSTLHGAGLLVGVIVPAAQNQNGAWVTGAYDWQALGAVVDYLQIELPLDPTAYMPGEDRLVEAMLRWGVGEVSRYKLVAGLNARSVYQTGDSFAVVSYDEALAALGDVQLDAQSLGNVMPGTPIRASLDGMTAQPGIDTALALPFVRYLNGDGTPNATAWLMTGGALRARLDAFDRFVLGGATLNDLSAEGLAADVTGSLADYRLRLPGDGEAAELALRWRVEGAGGVLLSEVETRLDEDLVVTLEAVEGNFAVNVEVVQGDRASVRSGAAVAQFRPTITPTPMPTATATLEPTITPTLQLIVPTADGGGGIGFVPPVNNAPVVAPGAGSIAVGNFEYGGHVTNSNSEVAASAMREAGMTWMKVQVGYVPGRSPSDIAVIINDARGRGFKILLGVVGRPSDLAAGGGDYIAQYAGFLGGLAALGPDAIEVWNEPNLDREWPRDTISGANYTSMLAQAYGQIKAANPSVLVISAAPAPTGAEAAYPGQVVNDDKFLQQMVNSGALGYADCIGVHYNEGIVGPTQTSGDPRDAYYTRYFPSMLDTYWGIIGGQKPLCFTELGYLTPEGYPGLDPYFAWASNTTVAQQSAWLAQAMSLASQSGKVRMLIVWNIDFTAYGTDPQGGFAIVRPGGGCPACAAIAGAR
ncbi:MAG: hypothetical protein H7Y11_01740, partial [Armatimonadetes bacterium]|nr:hypothetical protein [Anaerolineae bacterium]